MVRRPGSADATGRVWVFPGGRVESTDHRIDDDEIGVAANAAARELREETGVELDAGSLVPWSHWTTPEGFAKRYATWFFVVGVEDAMPGVRDRRELDAVAWFDPSMAVAQAEAGRLSLAPPQYVTLLELRAHATIESVMAHARREDPVRYLPRVLPGGGALTTVYVGDVAYEDPSIGADTSGPRHRVVVDDAGMRFERRD